MTTPDQTTAYPQQNYPPQPDSAGNDTTSYPAQQNTPPYPPPSYSPQPAHTVIQVPATTTTTNRTNTTNGGSKYIKHACVVTGLLQFIAAGTLVLLGIIIFSLSGYVGWNIVGSIFFYMVSGILGVVSKNQNKCVIVAYMVMSILSAVCAGGQVIFDITGATYYSFRAVDCNYIYPRPNYCEHAQALNALVAISAVVGFAEMIIAIVAASICCCGVCRSTTPAQTRVVTVTSQPAIGTNYPISTSAYLPHGQLAQPPPPSYSYLPPPQPQPLQQADPYEEKK